VAQSLTANLAGMEELPIDSTGKRSNVVIASKAAITAASGSAPNTEETNASTADTIAAIVKARKRRPVTDGRPSEPSTATREELGPRKRQRINTMWTKEEDAILLKAYEENRKNWSLVPWSEISAKYFSGTRTGVQCRSHFLTRSFARNVDSINANKQDASTDHLDSNATMTDRKGSRDEATTTANHTWNFPKTKSGRRSWSKEEDDQLKKHVHEMGARNWHVVASKLGRRPSGCRERWANVSSIAYYQDFFFHCKRSSSDVFLLFLVGFG
jgi:hypothetical protein